MCPSVKRFRTSSLLDDSRNQGSSLPRPAKMNCVTTQTKCMASDCWTLDHVWPNTTPIHSAMHKHCPLWVNSGHMQCKKPSPLYPQKRTFLVMGMSISANSRHPN